MTVNETKALLEEELKKIYESFGEASHLLKYDVQTEENEIEGAETDYTAVFGTLSIGTDDMTEDERLYLPIDAELDDNDNVDEEKLRSDIEEFKAHVEKIRERILASSDHGNAVHEIIKEYDEEIEAKYKEKLAKMEQDASRRLKIAAIATAIVAAVAAIIVIFQAIS